MKSASQYRSYAERCLEMAERAHAKEARQTLLEMADTWLELATQTHSQQSIELGQNAPSSEELQ